MAKRKKTELNVQVNVDSSQAKKDLQQLANMQAAANPSAASTSSSTKQIPTDVLAKAGQIKQKFNDLYEEFRQALEKQMVAAGRSSFNATEQRRLEAMRNRLSREGENAVRNFYAQEGYMVEGLKKLDQVMSDYERRANRLRELSVSSGRRAAASMSSVNQADEFQQAKIDDRTAASAHKAMAQRTTRRRNKREAERLRAENEARLASVHAAEQAAQFEGLDAVQITQKKTELEQIEKAEIALARVQSRLTQHRDRAQSLNLRYQSESARLARSKRATAFSRRLTNAMEIGDAAVNLRTRSEGPSTVDKEAANLMVIDQNEIDAMQAKAKTDQAVVSSLNANVKERAELAETIQADTDETKKAKEQARQNHEKEIDLKRRLRAAWERLEHIEAQLDPFADESEYDPEIAKKKQAAMQDYLGLQNELKGVQAQNETAAQARSRFTIEQEIDYQAKKAIENAEARRTRVSQPVVQQPVVPQQTEQDVEKLREALAAIPELTQKEREEWERQLDMTGSERKVQEFEAVIDRLTKALRSMGVVYESTEKLQEDVNRYDELQTKRRRHITERNLEHQLAVEQGKARPSDKVTYDPLTDEEKRLGIKYDPSVWEEPTVETSTVDLRRRLLVAIAEKKRAEGQVPRDRQARAGTLPRSNVESMPSAFARLSDEDSARQDAYSASLPKTTDPDMLAAQAEWEKSLAFFDDNPSEYNLRAEDVRRPNIMLGTNARIAQLRQELTELQRKRQASVDQERELVRQMTPEAREKWRQEQRQLFAGESSKDVSKKRWISDTERATTYRHRRENLIGAGVRQRVSEHMKQYRKPVPPTYGPPTLSEYRGKLQLRFMRANIKWDENESTESLEQRLYRAEHRAGGSYGEGEVAPLTEESLARARAAAGQPMSKAEREKQEAETAANVAAEVARRKAAGEPQYQQVTQALTEAKKDETKATEAVTEAKQEEAKTTEAATAEDKKETVATAEVTEEKKEEAKTTEAAVAADKKETDATVAATEEKKEEAPAKVNPAARTASKWLVRPKKDLNDADWRDYNEEQYQRSYEVRLATAQYEATRGGPIQQRELEELMARDATRKALQAKGMLPIGATDDEVIKLMSENPDVQVEGLKSTRQIREMQAAAAEKERQNAEKNAETADQNAETADIARETVDQAAKPSGRKASAKTLALMQAGNMTYEERRAEWEKTMARGGPTKRQQELMDSGQLPWGFTPLESELATKSNPNQRNIIAQNAARVKQLQAENETAEATRKLLEKKAEQNAREQDITQVAADVVAARAANSSKEEQVDAKVQAEVELRAALQKRVEALMLPAMQGKATTLQKAELNWLKSYQSWRNDSLQHNELLVGTSEEESLEYLENSKSPFAAQAKRDLERFRELQRATAVADHAREEVIDKQVNVVAQEAQVTDKKEQVVNKQADLVQAQQTIQEAAQEIVDPAMLSKDEQRREAAIQKEYQAKIARYNADFKAATSDADRKVYDLLEQITSSTLTWRKRAIKTGVIRPGMPANEAEQLMAQSTDQLAVSIRKVQDSFYEIAQTNALAQQERRNSEIDANKKKADELAQQEAANAEKAVAEKAKLNAENQARDQADIQQNTQKETQVIAQEAKNANAQAEVISEEQQALNQTQPSNAEVNKQIPVSASQVPLSTEQLKRTKAQEERQREAEEQQRKRDETRMLAASVMGASQAEARQKYTGVQRVLGGSVGLGEGKGKMSQLTFFTLLNEEMTLLQSMDKKSDEYLTGIERHAARLGVAFKLVPRSLEEAQAKLALFSQETKDLAADAEKIVQTMASQGKSVTMREAILAVQDARNKKRGTDVKLTKDQIWQAEYFSALKKDINQVNLSTGKWEQSLVHSGRLLKDVDGQLSKTAKMWKQFSASFAGFQIRFVGQQLMMASKQVMVPMQQYSQAMGMASITSAEWNDNMQRIQKSTLLIGEGLTEAALPTLETAADLIGTIAKLIDDNPWIGQVVSSFAIGTFAIGGLLQVAGTVMTAMAALKYVSPNLFGITNAASESRQILEIAKNAMLGRQTKPTITAATGGVDNEGAMTSFALAGTTAGNFATAAGSVVTGLTLATSALGLLTIAVNALNTEFMKDRQYREKVEAVERLSEYEIQAIDQQGGNQLGWLKELYVRYKIGELKDENSKKVYDDIVARANKLEKLAQEKALSNGTLGPSQQAIEAFIQFTKSMQETEKQYEKERTSVVKEYANQRLEAEKQYAKSIADIDKQIAALKNDTDDETKSYYLERNRSIKTFSDTERQQEQDYYRERAKLSRDYNIDVQRAEQDHQTKMRDMQEDHNSKVRDLLDDRDAFGLLAENERYETERQRAERDYAEEAKRKSEDFALRLQDMEAEFAIERQRRNRDFQEQLMESFNQRKQQREAQIADLEQQKKDLELQHKEDMIRIDKEEKERLAELDKNHAEEKATLQRNFNDQLRQLDAFLLGETKMYNEYYQRMKMDLNNWLLTMRGQFASGLPGYEAIAKQIQESGVASTTGTAPTTTSKDAYTGSSVERAVEKVIGDQSRAVLNDVTVNQNYRFDGSMTASERAEYRRVAREEAVNGLTQLLGA